MNPSRPSAPASFETCSAIGNTFSKLRPNAPTTNLGLNILTSPGTTVSRSRNLLRGAPSEVIVGSTSSRGVTSTVLTSPEALMKGLMRANASLESRSSRLTLTCVLSGVISVSSGAEKSISFP